MKGAKVSYAGVNEGQNSRQTVSRSDSITGKLKKSMSGAPSLYCWQI